MLAWCNSRSDVLPFACHCGNRGRWLCCGVGCTIGCKYCDNHTQHTNGDSLCPVEPPPPPGPPPSCTLTEGKNFNGADLTCAGQLCPQPTPNPGACCELCGSKPSDEEPKGTCSAWTWLAGQCYLKTGHGALKTQAGCTSGTVAHRGSPHPRHQGRSPMEPTNNDPMTRTMNRDAVAGSVNDTYRYNPWRAPGFAPVSDACGLAGGRHASDPGGGDAVFTSIPSIPPNGPISIGQLGSQVLKKGPPMATWKAGSTVMVSWGIRFNHGGGTWRHTLKQSCGSSLVLSVDGNDMNVWQATSIDCALRRAP